jgi:hypothetical protein
MVRDILKENDDDGYWTDTQLNRLVNSGVREFARQSKSIEGCWSMDVQPGVQNYAAPHEMIPGTLRYVEFEPPGLDRHRLETMDERVFRFEYQKWTLGVPYQYGIWEDCIYLGPTPKRYDEAPIRIIAEGATTYALMPNGADRFDLLTNSTTLVGKDLLVLEVVTAASISLTGDNKVVLQMPEDEVFVLFDTTSTVGTCTVVLDNFILKVKLPSGDTANLVQTTLQSHHGILHVHGYADPEPFQLDTDGCLIHDTYTMAPAYYASFVALMGDEKPVMANIWKRLFDGMVVEANTWARKQQWDQGLGVKTAMEELGRPRAHGRNS